MKWLHQIHLYTNTNTFRTQQEIVDFYANLAPLHLSIQAGMTHIEQLKKTGGLLGGAFNIKSPNQVNFVKYFNTKENRDLYIASFEANSKKYLDYLPNLEWKLISTSTSEITEQRWNEIQAEIASGLL